MENKNIYNEDMYSHIDKQLFDAMSHEVPDVLDNILAACNQLGKGMDDMENKIENTTTLKKKTKNLYKIFGTLAAMLCIALGMFAYSGITANSAVDSIINLDVNPSVELQVNKKEKIVSATALNKDGALILNDMDLKGSNLDVAVNAIIGSMLANGFIDELANSILVSVENEDTARGNELMKKLTQDIEKILGAGPVEGAILGQTISSDSAIRALADANKISLGKASLVKQIAEKNALLKTEDLAKLSVNELNLLASSQATKLSGVNSTGTASTKSYIGEPRAKELALQHLGLSATGNRITAKLDFDDGKMVYEVDIRSGNYEYEVEVDAINGQIVKTDKDYDDDNDDDDNSNNSPNPVTGATPKNSTPPSSGNKTYHNDDYDDKYDDDDNDDYDDKYDDDNDNDYDD